VNSQFLKPLVGVPRLVPHHQ